MSLKPYDLTTHDGNKVDAITDQALDAAEKILGYPLTVTQGSYNAGGVAASSGTHDGGGVVDLAPADWKNKVRVMRQIGFAAWHRTPSQGPWPEHIHCVLIGNEKLSPAAESQVKDYLAGRNGLASHAPDDGPRDYVNARHKWVADPTTPHITAAIAANLLLKRALKHYVETAATITMPSLQDDVEAVGVGAEAYRTRLARELTKLRKHEKK